MAISSYGAGRAPAASCASSRTSRRRSRAATCWWSRTSSTPGYAALPDAQPRLAQPASLEVCALLTKPARREIDVPIRYVGFEIPDRFVVGYGLDLRALPQPARHRRRRRDPPGGLRVRAAAVVLSLLGALVAVAVGIALVLVGTASDLAGDGDEVLSTTAAVLWFGLAAVPRPPAPGSGASRAGPPSSSRSSRSAASWRAAPGGLRWRPSRPWPPASRGRAATARSVARPGRAGVALSAAPAAATTGRRTARPSPSAWGSQAGTSSRARRAVAARRLARRGAAPATVGSQASISSTAASGWNCTPQARAPTRNACVQASVPASDRAGRGSTS